jgi:O-antigen ligase
MTTQTADPIAEVATPRRSLDLAELLFLAGTIVAPLNLLLVASFSVYDIIIVAVAFLLLVGPGRIQPVPPGLAIAGYVFVFAALVSTLRATQPLESITQIAQFAFIFFVQLPVVITIARSRFMVWATLVCFAIGSFAGVAEAFLSGQTQSAGRLLTFFSDNPNRLGYLASCVVPFVLLFLGTLYRRRRVVLATSLAVPLCYLTVWPLAASASRGATVAALVAILVYVALRPGQRPIRLVMRLLIATVLVLSVAWVLLKTDQFPETLRERIERTGQAEERAVLLDDRERLAVAGLRAFQESPFVGTGLDNFRHVAVRYEPAASNQAPHNMWIQSLAQVGIVGTLAFFYMIASWFVRVYRAAARHGVANPDGDLLWALFAAMVSIMTILMTVPAMIQRHYWLLYGLALALVIQLTQGREDPAPHAIDAGEERRKL